MIPEECRELAAELPETSGIRRALLMNAERQERGETSLVLLNYVPNQQGHVLTGLPPDGLCLVCDECDGLEGHDGPHDCGHDE